VGEWIRWAVKKEEVRGDDVFGGFVWSGMQGCDGEVDEREDGRRGKGEYGFVDENEDDFMDDE